MKFAVSTRDLISIVTNFLVSFLNLILPYSEETYWDVVMVFKYVLCR